MCDTHKAVHLGGIFSFISSFIWLEVDLCPLVMVTLIMYIMGAYIGPVGISIFKSLVKFMTPFPSPNGASLASSGAAVSVTDQS